MLARGTRAKGIVLVVVGIEGCVCFRTLSTFWYARGEWMDADVAGQDAGCLTLPGVGGNARSGIGLHLLSPSIVGQGGVYRGWLGVNMIHVGRGDQAGSQVC